MNRLLSRRMILRGAAGVTFALPVLSDIPRAHAQAKSADAGTGDAAASAGPIKRLLILFSPNGTIMPSGWASTGSGATFQPGPIFNQLVTDGHQNDIIVMENLDMAVALDGPGGDAHGLGIGCMLTGTELSAGSMFQAGMGGPGSGWPGGISVDQFIASQLKSQLNVNTPQLSIDFAVKRMAGSLWSRMSYTGVGETVEPFDDPTVAFSTLFASVGLSSGAMATLNARRKSVLDEVMAEANALLPSLSGTDADKVNNHLSQIRLMESQLTSMTSVGCTKPTAPTLTASPPVEFNASGMEVLQDPSVDADVPMRNELSQQMLVAAMSCDMARVGTIMMAPSRSDIYLVWLPGGSNESHHNLSHEATTNVSAENMLIAINQWYAGQVSALITKLKAVPEGNGTMFDNTVILLANELGIGNAHTHTNVPFMIAGSAGGYFKTGQAVSLPGGSYSGGPGMPHNRLLLSLCQAMGLSQVTTFGTAKYCTGGPITQIMA
jgi:hypothetical protein